MGDQTQQTATVHRVVLQCLLWTMILLANSAHPVAGQSTPVPSDASTPTPLGSILAFESGVWAKVAERTCIRCHHLQGEAKDSNFLLESSIDGLYDSETLARNQNAMRSVAKKTSGEKSILLQKVVGGLEHGGGQILKPDSTGFRILESFVAQTLLPTNEPKSNPAIDSYEQAPFFDGITMLSESRLLRRITLSLVGRLPTSEESNSIQQDGLVAIHPILDSILREDAFYVRLKEGFNDIFLTIGIAGGPYLGLLGTVIGVMITFAVIAKSGQVEVNSIAPGIAGALLATVAGLAVAIPALFAYSYLSSQIKDAISDMQVFIDEMVTKIAEFYSEPNR